ncbi:MAG: hypothetical protein OEV66_11850 [Spirochaetia bacterium]|nr:hypothetical protein [Spirochaetia bacterium]
MNAHLEEMHVPAAFFILSLDNNASHGKSSSLPGSGIHLNILIEKIF